MTKVLLPEHVVQIALRREKLRAEWEREFVETLRRAIRTGMELEPFSSGAVVTHIRTLLLDVEAEMGDARAKSRRYKKTISQVKRMRIYTRDDFTCQECGFRQTIEQVREAARLAKETGSNRLNRFLTLDHIIPRSEGGSSDDDNLMTLCSDCNNRKQSKLPDWLLEDTTVPSDRVGTVVSYGDQNKKAG